MSACKKHLIIFYTSFTQQQQLPDDGTYLIPVNVTNKDPVARLALSFEERNQEIPVTLDSITLKQDKPTAVQISPLSLEDASQDNPQNVSDTITAVLTTDPGKTAEIKKIQLPLTNVKSITVTVDGEQQENPKVCKHVLG